MPIIDKKRDEAFTISITVSNTGDVAGTWTIYPKLAGDWSWEGTPQTVTIEPATGQTLSFDGTIPTTTVHCQTANLSIIADSTELATDWQIHVLGEAVLSIGIIGIA